MLSVLQMLDVCDCNTLIDQVLSHWCVAPHGVLFLHHCCAHMIYTGSLRAKVPRARLKGVGLGAEHPMF